MSRKRETYRLTETLCKTLPAPEKGNRLYFDSVLPGLSIRVTAAGSRGWVLTYRTAGRQRRMTIGAWPAWSPKLARDEAKRIQVRVDKGADPLAEKQRERDAYTLEEWGKRYVDEHARPNKRATSLAEDERNIRDMIQHFGCNKKFKELTRPEIRRFHSTYKNQPRTGNKVLATLSHMYTCAMADEILGIDSNLVVGVKRFSENRRERFLSGQELQDFVESLRDFTEETKAVHLLSKQLREKNKKVRLLTELRLFQFLLLTGARLGETLKAKWQDIDFERGVWTKPSHHTKQNKTEHVPLSSAALQLLSEWNKEPKRSESTLIFPGSISSNPIVYPRKTWANLTKRAGVEDFKIHDLRHTYASQLVMSGKSLTIVGRLLGHTQPATTARYAHLADDPLREATEGVGGLLSGMEAGQKAELVDLPRRSKA